MGAATVPLVTAGASLFAGMDANKKAKASADKASGRQKELIKRQTQLFDTIRGIVEGYDQSGGFDPSRMVQNRVEQGAAQEQLSTSNMAGALSVLGYKPGDTVASEQVRRVSRNIRDATIRDTENIKRQAFADKIGAYRAIDPSQLNPGIQVYGQQANQAMSQMQNPAGFFQAAMPFLQGNPFKVGGGNAQFSGTNIARYLRP